MTIESLVCDALNGLVDERIWPDVAPAGTPRPYITYQQVGGEAINYVEGGIPNLSNARMQVNVWADTRASASAIGKLVEDALRGVEALQTKVIGARIATYDEALKLRGTIQDFSFWN